MEVKISPQQNVLITYVLQLALIFQIAEHHVKYRLQDFFRDKEPIIIVNLFYRKVALVPHLFKISLCLLSLWWLSTNGDVESHFGAKISMYMISVISIDKFL